MPKYSPLSMIMLVNEPVTFKERKPRPEEEPDNVIRKSEPAAAEPEAAEETPEEPAEEATEEAAEETPEEAPAEEEKKED